MKKYAITDIEYDTDDENLTKEDLDLPKELVIEVSDEYETDDEIEEYVSDEISNITGFCHKGFSMDLIID